MRRLDILKPMGLTLALVGLCACRAAPSAPAVEACPRPDKAPETRAPAQLSRAALAACRSRDHQEVRRLLEAGADPDHRDGAGASLLLVAAGLGDEQTVSALLQAGADIHVVDGAMGVSALHRAAQAGSVPILTALLDRGAYIDQQSAVNGHTPLLDACFYKRYAAIDFLLRRGANMALRNTLGLTPMDWALRQKDDKIKALLQEQGRRDADLTQKQALLAAVRANDLARVKQLVGQGADVDQVARDGNTPLLIAAKFGYTEIIRTLLEKGADPNKVDRLMKATPGHKAGFFGHAEITRLLVKHGLKLDAQGPYNGYTALHDALLNRHEETAEVLIRAGASVTIKGIDGKSPRDLAQAMGLTRLLGLMKR